MRSKTKKKRKKAKKTAPTSLHLLQSDQIDDELEFETFSVNNSNTLSVSKSLETLSDHINGTGPLDPGWEQTWPAVDRVVESKAGASDDNVDFPIRASVVSCSVSLAGLETTLLCLELCPMGWK